MRIISHMDKRVSLSAAGGGRRWLTPVLSFALVAAISLAAGDAATTPTQAIEVSKARTAQVARASFTIADYHRWRDNIAKQPANATHNTVIPAPHSQASAQSAAYSLPFGALGDSANGETLSQLVVDIANGDNVNDTFNNFYHNAQLRLFSALDNALAAKATDIIGGYDAVKSAQVKFQSALGSRKAQLGVDVIGAIKESNKNAENAQRYGIGWQLHIYAAEGKSKGASGGIFYRRIQNNILYGVNVFADYEDHNYGDFYRYGIGGELQNEHFKFAANYYAPITDDKTLQIKRTQTVVALSREGYDANIQIAIPGAQYLQAEAAYYHFDGKHNAEADKGFRYGAALSPAGGIKLRVFYDDGGEEFGGELSWLYKFHHRAYEGLQQHNTPNNVADLFAPVLREHSQRIALATIFANIPPPQFGILARNAQVNNTVAIATLNIPTEYFDGTAQIFVSSSLPQADISLSDTLPLITVYYTPSAANVEGVITIIARGDINESPVATSFVASVSSFAAFAAAFDNPPRGRYLTEAIVVTVGTLLPRDGVMPYRFSSSRYDVIVNDAGLVLFDTEGREKTITAVLTIDDSAAQTPPITMSITLTAVAFEFINAAVAGDRATVFLAGNGGDVAMISVSGGIVSPGSEYNFSIIPSGGGFAFVPAQNTPSSRQMRFNRDTAATITAIVIVDDEDARIPPISLYFTATAVAPLAASFGVVNDGFLSDRRDAAGTVRVSGGLGDLTYVLMQQSGAGYVQTGNSLAVMANVNTSTRYFATIRVDDDIDLTPAVSVYATADVYPPVGYGGIGNVRSDGLFITAANQQFYGNFRPAGGGVGGPYVTTIIEGIQPEAGAGAIRFTRNTPGRITNRYRISDSSSHRHADITPNLTVMAIISVVIRRQVTANVHFRTAFFPGVLHPGHVVVSTRAKRRLVLPPDFGERPIVFRTPALNWSQVNGTDPANWFRIVERNSSSGAAVFLLGTNWPGFDRFQSALVTVIEGSEEIIP